MEQKDYERIATLETQLETLSKGLERIETKLDAYSTNFITRLEADIHFKNLEKEIDEIKQNKRANSALIVSCLSVILSTVFALINLIGGK
ncbi:hypothetical protein NRS6186_22240 (plasmid) [Bacillus subtilis]|uniref:Uncharacterized protein n=3 Tax=Bacillus subtilis TaxID=1423 RepID=S5DTL6_BACIU|nr:MULTISPECIES: hypothetical protein [Bacillus]MBU8845686.1 hypothetical protein [Alkalicoccobacillus gibsonii]AGQ21247.1 unknown [Bacillus subtilis subsp. subtilis NCIB 3610 = ATCC 6051 = DSM 10]AJO60811.1 hypothetical protein QF06_20270 [Bacillus sp. YP1]AQZ93160.1 hypothetical protein B4U62_22140 [Bacillus subtilis]AXF35640.1 hypothetical protein DS740_22485 [Bacillus sp. DM2]